MKKSITEQKRNTRTKIFLINKRLEDKAEKTIQNIEKENTASKR